ncbi:MAG: SRPBCC domain-containing protein [Candidatus Eremiobacteraeota bacterium]|nr:SRPBCC domain-containing protein [Candidatus Eremiobacteraeota bacterium]
MSNTSTTAGERLVLRRKYNAKRDRVWKAWTDKDEMMAWHAPEGSSVAEYIVDLRIGGAFRLAMLQPSGEKYVAKGVYREITPPERLSYTWIWEEDTPEEEHETLLSIEFNDLGEETEVVLTHENLASAESRDRHTEGWNQVLDKLTAHLEPAR